MENFGAIYYREERSIIDENNTPYNQKISSMLTIAHEMGNYSESRSSRMKIWKSLQSAPIQNPITQNDFIWIGDWKGFS